MSLTPANVYLETCLEPLAAHLARPDVTDIYINRAQELWTETLDGRTERYEAPDLTGAVLMRLARQVAAVTAQGISREYPLLSANLPSGERVQIVIPPATRGEIAIAIRKHAVAGMVLEDYQASGAFAATKFVSEAASVSNAQLAPLDAFAFLREAVRERRNILISGGTSSGKTTFLNSLLTEIPAHERIILIEDAPELRLVHENAVGMLARRGALGEAAISAEDLLIAALRMRPDRIMLGEIRGVEAATFLRSVNTGHPGSMTTIHADSPRRAIDQLALLVLQTGMRLMWEDVVTYIRRSLDVIVQLTRGPQGRRIESIMQIADT